jgi:hypothetical protein
MSGSAIGRLDIQLLIWVYQRPQARPRYGVFGLVEGLEFVFKTYIRYSRLR